MSETENYDFPLSYVLDLLSVSKFAPPATSSSLETTDICETISTRNGTDYCTTNFLFNGNFKDCGSNLGVGENGEKYDIYGNLRRNLIFEAVCIPDLIQVGRDDNKRYLSPSKIVKIVSTLDALSILVFILGISWLKRVMDKQKKESDQDICTASDYTIICYTLPKKVKGEKDVKMLLKNHLEEVLNKNKKILTNEIKGSKRDKENDLREEIKIVDINCSTHCSEYLTAAEARGQASVVVDRLVAKIRSSLRTTKFHLRHSIARIRNLNIRSKDGMIVRQLEPYDLEKADMIYKLKIALYKFEYYNDQCMLLNETAQNSVHSAYVTFANEYSYADCMRQLPNVGILTRLIQSKKYHLDGQTLFIKVSNTIRFTFLLFDSVFFYFFLFFCFNLFYSILIYFILFFSFLIAYFIFSFLVFLLKSCKE